MEPAYDNRQRTWTMLCHLSSLIVLLGIPFGNILGPFVVWLFKKNDFPWWMARGASPSTSRSP